MISSTYVAAALVLAYAVYRLSRIGTREGFLPPGPPTVPILGNLHIFPKAWAYLKFTEWSRQYGDCYSLKIGSGTMVVISSAKAFNEIIDKNSNITADRPPNYFADQVTSGGLNMVLLVIRCDKWRSLRRGAHEVLNLTAAKTHRPLQDSESAQLMYEFLTTPEKAFTSVQRFASSVILSVVFGKRAPQFTTKEVTAFFHVQHIWEYLLFPGSFAPVDHLPFLKYFPEPLAKWKPVVREVRDLQRELYFGLLEETERRKEDNGCYMETILARSQEWGLDREMVGYLGGVLMEAGSDTTSSYLNSLILGIIAFPECQKKAHEELDRVVGHDRAPEFDDLENLPYIQAITKETHRFRPNAPLIPRSATEDLFYNGYKIPKGTDIIANMWGIFHDPDVYENPEWFWPDRYMKSDVGTKTKDVPGQRNDMAFGGGRRVCAGIHVAKYSLAVVAMNLLWAFEFSPARDEKSQEIKPDIWNYAQALGSAPNPFQCTIKPRSAHHAEMVRKRFVDATPHLQAFEHELSEEDRIFLTKMRAEATSKRF
ncbi:cytochrome P450 [Cytidiella melzeri]|nr:cytochrome P450 [Cytidiella melzeri]